MVDGSGVGQPPGGFSASNNLFGVNPQFANPDAGDFRLQATSAAIDVGVVLSAVPTDINGKPRTQGGRYDIGAYEYGASPLSQLPTPKNLRVISVTP